jgi:hypothetical protein
MESTEAETVFKMVKEYRRQIYDRVKSSGTFKMRVMNNDYEMRLEAVEQAN